jgi:hypothetical protein
MRLFAVTIRASPEKDKSGSQLIHREYKRREKVGKRSECDGSYETGNPLSLSFHGIGRPNLGLSRPDVTAHMREKGTRRAGMWSHLLYAPEI